MTNPLHNCRRFLSGARAAMLALRKDLTRASRHLPWPAESPMLRIGQAGGVSPEWLRTHAVESAKHLDDS